MLNESVAHSVKMTVITSPRFQAVLITLERGSLLWYKGVNRVIVVCIEVVITSPVIRKC